MASTNKTALGLNQWEPQDKPRVEDFNEDNRRIDELLSNKVDKSEQGVWTPQYITEIDEKLTPIPCDYARQFGNYCKTGSSVFVCGELRTNAIQTQIENGSLLIGYLPFPIQKNILRITGCVGYTSGFKTLPNGYAIQIWSGGSANYIRLVTSNYQGMGGNFADNLSSFTNLMFAFSYYTD